MHGRTRTDDGRTIELELRRNILTLWQTALVRLSRLKIQDEIETGLRYYSAAFFEVIPQVNAEVRTALQARWPDAHVLEQPILRPGSWIGGDRDGNPNVTADVVRLATGSASYTALAHYFVELTALEQELSMSVRLVRISDELARPRRHLRRARPRRRAVSPGAAGDPRSLDGDRGTDPGPATRVPARPRHGALRDARRVPGRPRRHRRVAARQRQRGTGRRPARAGCGKPCTCSAFTCPAWICGRTPTCTKR